MQMTEEEIKRNYTGAKNKRDQIKVLAELNCTSISEIREILVRTGIKEDDLPAKAGRKKAEKPDIPDAVKDACSKEMVNLQQDIDKNEDIIRDLQEQNRKKEAAMVELRKFCE